MKIWFQNRRYKCKRQLSDKPMDSTSGMVPSPETESMTTPLRKMTDESNITSVSAPETEEPNMIYHHHDLHQQQDPILPPYSTLYNHQNSTATLPYSGTPSYHQQDMSYHGTGAPGEAASYYALMGGSNATGAGQPFHQHSFTSSVRAW